MSHERNPVLGFESDRLRGRKQIADFLGVHVQTVDRWRRREKDPLPVFVPGREVEALKSELAAWVHEQRGMQP